METPRPNQTVSELTRSIPGAARVFERYGIDFCCGGKRSLQDACQTAQAPLDAVVHDLVNVRPEPGDVALPERLDALIDHVYETHHVFEREELARLFALAAKVARVHGDRHPETRRVHTLVAELRADIEPHMLKEEHVLFPYMRALATGQSARPPFGTVENPIRMMLVEHEAVGAILTELSSVTNRYTPPADACNSYRALYEGLAALQADIHQHVHVENDVMFPQAIALEQQALRSAG